MRVLMLCALLLCAGQVSARTVTYACEYPLYADSKGAHKATDLFRMTFLLDIEGRKAYLIGNNGSSEVDLIPNHSGGFTLVEVTVTNNLMVTVIADTGKSVHSRQGIISGEIIPSQYYGTCVVQ